MFEITRVLARTIVIRAMPMLFATIVLCLLMFVPVASAGLDIKIDVRVPVGDEVDLSARAWLPKSNSGVPTVFLFTPYLAAEYSQARATEYTKHDYAYVVADVRGRGASGGTFTPHQGHGADACAVIDWIKRQPWSDGRVVLEGSSYQGMVQWHIAAKCANKLSAMVPTAAAYAGVDMPALDNQITAPYMARWLAIVEGRAANFALFSDNAYWTEKYLEWYLNHRPLHEFDNIAGVQSPWFDRWVNQLGDASLALWHNDNPTTEEMAKIRIPVLSVTGHFDGNQPGTLRYYREHLTAAPANTTDRHYLLMGPWDHAGTREARASVGGLQLSENAAPDLLQLHIDFFNWILRDGKRPALLQGRVNYYTVGDEQWYSARRLEDIGQKRNILYLSAKKDEAEDVFSSGHLLNEAPQSEEPTSYVSDPLDLTPAYLCDDWCNIDQGSFRQGEESDYLRSPEDAFLPQMRIFHSAPLKARSTLSGHLKLVLHLSMDVSDTDIYASVFAVRRDGSVIKLGRDFMRARFREGTAKMKLVEANVVEEYVFQRFYWTSFTLEPGTRLRVVVGPLNRPYMPKNYNSGGRLGYETAQDARTATIKIHHNEDYPSRLELPIE